MMNRKVGYRSMPDATPLNFPQLGPVYQALFPWAEALLRAVVGLALVPHGLRNTFGMFPSTGVQSHNLTELAKQLDRDGYRPGKFWAPAISLTPLVAGPMLALGLFTRLAACPIVIFLLVSNYERWRDLARSSSHRARVLSLECGDRFRYYAKALARSRPGIMRSFAVNIHATTSPAVSTAEWQARVDLAAVYRLVAHYGWDDVIYNHCSMRAPGEDRKFLMKRHELLWTEVTASNLA